MRVAAVQCAGCIVMMPAEWVAATASLYYQYNTMVWKAVYTCLRNTLCGTGVIVMH